MVIAAIGGMQLKSLTGYFKVIIPTLKVLKAAKGTDGCVHAETYKHGDVFFAVSIWENEEQMQEFARTGLHGELMPGAMKHLGMFFNHSAEVEEMPSREEMAAMWRTAIAARGGEGTVGNY
jgi:hypothetical protein